MVISMKSQRNFTLINGEVNINLSYIKKKRRRDLNPNSALFLLSTPIETEPGPY